MNPDLALMGKHNGAILLIKCTHGDRFEQRRHTPAFKINLGPRFFAGGEEGRASGGNNPGSYKRWRHGRLFILGDNMVVMVHDFW